MALKNVSHFDNNWTTWQVLCMFFFGYFGAWPCTKPGKIQKVVMRARITNQKMDWDHVPNAVLEHKTKYVQGQQPSNIYLSLFFGLFVWCGLPSHFHPLECRITPNLSAFKEIVKVKINLELRNVQLWRTTLTES